MPEPIDGFWLPKDIRAEMITPETEYETLSFARGQPCTPQDEGAVTVRWPKLGPGQWQYLLARLRQNRLRSPRGQEFCDRLLAALQSVSGRFSDSQEFLRQQAQTALPQYTGYSEAMIAFTLASLDLMMLDPFAAAFAQSPTRRVASGWQPMAGLPGRLRFFEAERRWLPRRLRGRDDKPFFGSYPFPEMIVGYGAGNVPGTALLITLLSQSTALLGDAPPAVVIKNSRREPIFSPLVLGGMEAADPDLLSSVAVLVWDYNDEEVQRTLLSQAHLVVAAASDETIAQIAASLRRTGPTPGARLHAHGHKVSFSAIGHEALDRGLGAEGTGEPWIDVVTLLAALDSAFWDQYGCLSSRIHFVETGNKDPALRGVGDGYSAVEYAERLTARMRLLASFLPRGAWPRQQLHDAFDRYKLLEAAGKAQVVSQYDDEFVVALDLRALDAVGLRQVVNGCQGRVIIVRPVADLMEVPGQILRQLPADNLQSLSVAVGWPGEGLTGRFLRFAEGCGARGVTAIRTVGRGAFPQLAYSWDGFIPLDLVRRRPKGHFTTIEFDTPYDETLATYRLLMQRGGALGMGRMDGR